MIVTDAAARVTAGSARCTSKSRRSPPPYGANMPEAGSQPSQSAKITISTMPSQKTGMLAPKSEATALSRSSAEFGRIADVMPSARPPAVESRSAAPVSTSVALKRVSTSPSTGRFIQIDRPRSPRATSPSQCTYCTCSGWVRPSSARRRSRSAWVAWEPSMISAGSPGARCKTMKMMIETPSRTGTSSSRRRTTYRLTAWRTSLQRDRLDAEVEARVELEPLNPFGMGGGLDLVVDEDPRRIVDENTLGLAIERGALALVGRQPCLVQELVEALVLVE